MRGYCSSPVGDVITLYVSLFFVSRVYHPWLHHQSRAVTCGPLETVGSRRSPPGLVPWSQSRQERARARSAQGHLIPSLVLRVRGHLDRRGGLRRRSCGGVERRIRTEPTFVCVATWCWPHQLWIPKAARRWTKRRRCSRCAPVGLFRPPGHVDLTNFSVLWLNRFLLKSFIYMVLQVWQFKLVHQRLLDSSEGKDEEASPKPPFLFDPIC
jgi:hypothetical protein